MSNEVGRRAHGSTKNGSTARNRDAFRILLVPDEYPRASRMFELTTAGPSVVFLIDPNRTARTGCAISAQVTTMSSTCSAHCSGVATITPPNSAIAPTQHRAVSRSHSWHTDCTRGGRTQRDTETSRRPSWTAESDRISPGCESLAARSLAGQKNSTGRVSGDRESSQQPIDTLRISCGRDCESSVEKVESGGGTRVSARLLESYLRG